MGSSELTGSKAVFYMNSTWIQAEVSRTMRKVMLFVDFLYVGTFLFRFIITNIGNFSCFLMWMVDFKWVILVKIFKQIVRKSELVGAR